MALYTGRQLLVLFVLLAAAAAGLAVREWRAAHPELADRLEHIDRRPRGSDESVSTPARAVDPAPQPPVDLNRATSEELARLPGVGASLATRIVERRQSVGAFASVEDLRGVRGIGRVKLERLRRLVTVVE
jgi:competence ComEA-like helix-hairpin-helix protein